MRILRRSGGFTLVELLVALFAMAILAILSWRGLDGMTRAQAQTQARADEVLALQVGLAQWSADLDALVQFPQTTALDWNGRVLRLTRHAGPGADSGARVVGWTRRIVNGQGRWLRWQSQPLTTRAQLEQAWLTADAWSQNAVLDELRSEVAITPLLDWQIFYFRGDAWTNPQSSDATGVTGATPPPPGTPPPTSSPAAGRVNPGGRVSVLPDGVRLVLNLPPGQPISGLLTIDWVRPTVGGGKS
ncbi:PulJ/GspJ family protein [Ramlibacter tataouinensis]|uniref:Candidate pseudopilin, general secretion pathway protein J (PilD-dependent protein), component of type II secretion system n=1 Tax=Ramlibacter tataouinensis (strain ATCC BAA-407 / DSM 14655 / LMG 21543 / TTB310) TaxID=365046 RepID=F5Y0Q5_RAMTT|nr:prepilin-type N-terminal cleavage/methylation domain-containing protein [Ramlibacter tataouinensis]AEG94649.1 candidate pseudopilin, general secretion pathway protein J precursor (PilD-dependent protein), component of type II secretion system [Ramlibacter tataouinensis TTB310]